MEPEDLAVIGHNGDLLVEFAPQNAVHIYILPLRSKAAANLLDLAGMTAQSQRPRCAISAATVRNLTWNTQQTRDLFWGCPRISVAINNYDTVIAL